MKNKTNLIFCHKLIKAFADSLVKLFIPLIILKNSRSLMLVMLYLTSYYLICGFLNIALKKFLQKYGIVAMILHAFPIIAVQFLITSQITWWLCLIIAVLGAAGQTLYSVPLNILFAFTDKDVNVAKFQISTNVGKLIFIVFSGFVIGSGLKNSILFLAIAGTVLYLASIVPIVYGYNLLKDAYEKVAKHPPKIERKSYKMFNFYHIAFSLVQGVLDTVVPVYLYIENLAIESVAIVMALIEVCKICSNLLAKFMIKHNKSVFCVWISSACLTVGSVLMMIVKDALVLYICSCIIAVSFPLMFVPMFSAFVKKVAAENNQFDGMSYRDVYIAMSRGLMFVPFFVIPSLIAQFLIGIGGTIAVSFSSTKILIANNNERK